MAGIGGLTKGARLDPSRLPLTIQKRFGKLIESSKTSKLLSARVDYKLPRSSQTNGTHVDGSRFGVEKVCNRNGRRGERVFLEGISGAKEIGRVALSDRSVAVEQIASPSHISNGHAENDQTGNATRDVGYFDRLIGCLSSHSDQRDVSMLPLFSSGKGKIQVYRAPVWPNVRTLAIHGDSEAVEAMGSYEQSCAIPISRRLVKPKSVKKRLSAGNAIASRTLCKPRVTGEREEIRAGASSIDYLSRRKVGSGTGQGVSNGRASCKCCKFGGSCAS